MCTPTMALSAGLSAAGMAANRQAQNSAVASSQRAIDEQTRLSREQFDERTSVIKDSDARIRELEATGFNRADAAKQAYIERVGDILETQNQLEQQQFDVLNRRDTVLAAEGARTAAMRAEQEALVGDAIGASDFGSLSETVDRSSTAMGLAAAGLSGGSASYAGMSPELKREMLRREAEVAAEVMGREAAANRLAGTNIALANMGQAVENLRIGSGITAARFAAGSTLPQDLGAIESDWRALGDQIGALSGDMRMADLEATAIEPELSYIDKMTGIKSARTEGAVGASRQFEGSMANLAQQRAAAIQAGANTNVGDLLTLGGSAVGTYAANGGNAGSWFGPKPTPVKAPVQIAAGTYRRPTYTPYSAPVVGGIY